ncbi:MAG: ribosome maturation factor RimP [Filifactoraceae bacterium]
MAKLEEKIEELILPAIDKEFELVDVEYAKEGKAYYLRVLVDKLGGRISLDECTNISRKISTILDEKDPIKDPYMLEVSSPGIDRALKKPRDFQRENGKLVELKLYKAIDGQREFEGVLNGFEDEIISIDINGYIRDFNRKDVAIIKLKVDF